MPRLPGARIQTGETLNTLTFCLNALTFSAFFALPIPNCAGYPLVFIFACELWATRRAMDFDRSFFIDPHHPHYDQIKSLFASLHGILAKSGSRLSDKLLTFWVVLSTFFWGLYLSACAVSRSTQCTYNSAEQAMFQRPVPMVVNTVDRGDHLYVDG
uniref:Uncharacterized protein n=1 Tax=Hyaloperonospora arabidopsidis (strain Emoy2) TaxID=559515 RepID=M4BTM1_HYAAE